MSTYISLCYSLVPDVGVVLVRFFQNDGHVMMKKRGLGLKTAE
jgi:hypothetical protein